MDEDVDPDVEEAFRAAAAAVEADAPGCIDDVLLLELLLSRADENVLRALGSRSQVLLREATAERQRRDRGEREVSLPLADDVRRFAAMEAGELGGYHATVGAIHVLLALFAFDGSGSEEVLRRCGLDWRPLRSMTRRLGLSW